MPNKSILKPSTIAVVVLNYKGIEDTIECIKSLTKQSLSDYTIVVVENGSNDNSAAELEKIQSKYTGQVHVIYNSKNLGFTGGVNTGIRWALDKDYEFVALFNNDAVADENWLRELLNAMSISDSIGTTTGLLLNQSGDEIDGSSEQYSKWGLSFPRDRGKQASDAHSAGYTFGATGGATLYRTALFEDIGLFDDDFFAYYEDADINFRAQLAGWKSYYTPSAIAYHKQGATSSKIPGFTIYQTFKNLPLVFLKNVPRGLLLPIGLRFYLAYTLMYLNTFAHGTGWAATKGVWKSFILGFSALHKRRSIQRYKRVSTEYIKSILWNDLPPDQTGIRKVRKLFTRK